jgi:HlyD family secretion protein
LGIFAGRVSGKRAALVLAAIVLLAGALYVYFRPAPGAEAPLLFTVGEGDFTVKITELGELDALDSATVSAQIDLPVIYLAPEGATVAKGDLLVRFDAAKYEVALEDSKAALMVARADHRKARTDLEAQRQRLLAEVSRFETEVRLAQLVLDALKAKPLPDELARAELEFERTRGAYENAKSKMDVLPGLAEKGFITRDTLEKGALDLVEARANMQLAQFNLNKVKEGATPQELEEVRIRLEQGKYELERAKMSMNAQLQSFKAAVSREEANVGKAGQLVEKAEVSLKRGVIHAPREGLVVYARTEGREAAKVQLGMIPFEGQPLIYLPDLSAMVANTEISEFDIGKVTLGTPVEVRPEAYPGVVFQGEVLRIGNLARARRSAAGGATGIKVFDVTVKIRETDPRLKPGLTATLDIIAHRQKDAVFVPLAAVARRGEEAVVHVFRDGRLEARKVTLGPSNENSVIITEGLQPGETAALSLPPPGRR